MSISTQPLPAPPRPPRAGVSITTLLLSLALAVSVTAAVILAVLYFRQPGSASGGGGGGALAAIFGEEPLVQKDTVSPQSKYTGIVYYPTPYGSPPNLKLTASKRQYDIVKQDETGFTWMARPMLEDFKDERQKDAAGGADQHRLQSPPGQCPQAEPSVRGLHLGGQGDAGQQGGLGDAPLRADGQVQHHHRQGGGGQLSHPVRRRPRYRVVREPGRNGHHRGIPADGLQVDTRRKKMPVVGVWRAPGALRFLQLSPWRSLSQAVSLVVWFTSPRRRFGPAFRKPFLCLSNSCTEV